MAATQLDALVEELERSYTETQERMSDPSVYNDHREAAEVGRRLKELEAPYKLAQRWKQMRDDLAAARSDAELAEMVPEYESELDRLEEELKLSLVEHDPADEKDVIVEIRGDGAYSVFKYEGGTHRVQRVPETESQGRIHTSTATVAVMPAAEDVDVEVDEKDLKIDVYRSSGPGGQSVNTTDSAVRITHLPTNIVVSMQDERSQLQNREKAMRVLRARLYEAERERQQAEQAAARLAQVGTGARAEKIRTYNFPENRVTDHRIKHTVYRLDQVLQGDLDEFTDALTSEEQRRALEQ
jgi:peptide chain release factor 1